MTEAQPEAPPLVCIVVLSWNRASETLACLESLAALDYANYRVILVDNASSDGTPALVRERFPQVALIETGANLGYGGGNNVGIDAALAVGAAYVWVLNNDTVIPPTALSTLVRVAEAQPRAGAFSPRILTRDAPPRIWYAGGSLGTTLTRSTHHHMWRPDNGVAGPPRDASYLPGCAMLLRREAIQRVGSWNQRFFMYWEDVEYCLRLAQHGWRLVYVPESTILHTGAGSSDEPGGASATFDYYHTRNALWYLRDHATPLNILPSLTYRAASLALRVAQLALGHERDKTKKLQALAKGLRNGLLNYQRM
jgi:GT2 family glycosyltransferase